MGLILRPAGPEDRPACEQIYASVRELVHPGQPSTTLSSRDFEAATRGEDLWIAQSGASIRGWVAIYRPARFIHHLYVDPDHLRQGVGRALLSLALARCGGRAELKCDEANRRAQAFYLALGWRPVGWGWAPNGPWIRFAY